MADVRISDYAALDLVDRPCNCGEMEACGKPPLRAQTVPPRSRMDSPRRSCVIHAHADAELFTGFARASRREAVFASALVMLGAFVSTSLHADTPADSSLPPNGVWGVPRDDTNRFVNGTFFSVFRDADGQRHAVMQMEAGKWSCGYTGTVTWNAAVGRLEWPNYPPDGDGPVCWATTRAEGERMVVTVQCKGRCTNAAENTQALERFSTVALQPPERLTHLFCASHDPLRQALCVPGSLQRDVKRANAAADRLYVLSTARNDGSTTLPRWDPDQTTREFITSCASSRNGPACLESKIRAAAQAMETAVRGRQVQLATERAVSKAAEVELRESATRNAWIGHWMKINATFISQVSVKKCNETGCDVSIDADTNFTFGYARKHGECIFDDLPVRFTGPEAAYGYREPAAEERKPASAGPFANYCRVDLMRRPDGMHVAMQGAGCALSCFNTGAGFDPMQGDYVTLQNPSIDCHSKDFFQLDWAEQSICVVPALAQMDRDLAAAYARATAAAKQGDALQTMNEWSAQQRDNCADETDRQSCLLKAYQEQVQRLTPISPQPN